MTNARRLRQSLRLRTFDYLGTYVYHLVSATRGRAPLLRSPDAAAICTRALEAACLKYDFACLAYCFMPDHAHLLVSSEGGASAQLFMRHFKQLSGFAYKQSTGEHLWQISYYDRVARVEEAIRPIAQYIWLNPVRKGLAKAALEYPFSGPREHMAT